MKRITSADRWVILVAALAVLGTYWALWRGSGAAEYALVHSGSRPVARYALDEAREITVPGRLGPSVLEIGPGRIRFSDSPCRGKICLHAGWLSTAGAVAACLPNGISVEVVGVERVYDSINF